MNNMLLKYFIIPLITKHYLLFLYIFLNFNSIFQLLILGLLWIEIYIFSTTFTRLFRFHDPDHEFDKLTRLARFFFLIDFLKILSFDIGLIEN